MECKRLFIGGKWIDTLKSMDVVNPYNNEVIAKVCVAREEDVDNALRSAFNAKKEMANLPAVKRGEILDNLTKLIERDSDEIAKTISLESGKGLSFAKGEVQRSIETFKFSSDEARRISGELIPFDASKSGINRFGYYKRYPVGVVAAITPFNFPLNLVAHKVGPAIAAGCPIVLKPASTTPLTSIKLVELLLEAGLPEYGINLLVGSGKTVGNKIVESDLVNMITFTGSPEVGLEIKSKAKMKKVTLELGNNAPLIIHHDADIEKALPRCMVGAFSNSGQVCISIQRIYVHESRYNEFKEMFVEAVKSATVGNQLDEKTLVGPMITESEALRVENWIKEAVDKGAKILVGGKRERAIIYPTILENCTPDMKVVAEEVFAPVVCLFKYSNLEEAIHMANDTKYGLQAGIYTNDIKTAFKAIDELEYGGVMVNDMPTFRVDNMPYGGVKLSGTGREGARFSVMEMTELKTVMFNFN